VTPLLTRLISRQEWMVAISAFIVWIHGFGLADKLVKRAARQGRVHPWRKYRLQDRYEADKCRREMIRRKERGEDVDVNAPPPLVTEQSEWNWKGWICELPVYAVPLFIWDYLIPRRAAKIAAWGAPSTLQVCRDVTCGLLLYDAMFFVGHFLMHKIPFIYKTVHKKHHVNTEARAMEIVRLSIPEEVLEVGISIVALNYLQCHPVSRTIYNLIITFLLTELHCGFDFPWTPQNVVPFGFATGSRRHHYHHRYGKHYYQKFFCHVDRLFGCFQKNDGSLMGDSVQKCKEIPPSWQITTKA
jgi:sterol desaturase/sphingolipid hydroxylase (fatty acid hydroxylase superfamily)